MVDINRVPELVPAGVAKASHYKVDQAATIAAIADFLQSATHSPGSLG
jgi:NAD(P)H dehydrogenase (quinone)